jgi:hypothetical protein
MEETTKSGKPSALAVKLERSNTVQEKHKTKKNYFLRVLDELDKDDDRKVNRSSKLTSLSFSGQV